MTSNFAIAPGRHTDTTWDATDNVGWHDWSCWVPGRERYAVAAAPEQPSLRLVHSQASPARPVLLGRMPGECGMHHRPPLRTA